MDEKESFSRLQDFRIRDYQLQLETEKEEHAKTKRELEMTKEKLTSMEKQLNSLVGLRLFLNPYIKPSSVMFLLIVNRPKPTPERVEQVQSSPAFLTME